METTDSTTTQADTETDEGTPTETTSDEGGPGFTAGLTLLALLGAALLAARRRS